MKALITGVAGQDGSYLAEQLLAEGVEVWGVTRRPRVDLPGVGIVHADLLDQGSLEDALRLAKPDVVFNLAAVVAPGCGWGTPQPPLMAETTGLGVLHLLDAVLRVAPDAHVVHASSSAVYDPHRYGLYGAAKRFAHDTVIGYRKVLHCSNAVFFSHTSPRQDPRFLARHITSTVARIAAGLEQRLVLGDVESRRDWGWAPDYMRALPLIAAAEPGDYPVATGVARSVRELTQYALDAAGLGWDVIDIAPDAWFPDELPPPDLTATRALGWKPETDLRDGIADMVACA